jgi:hypothetical protein
MAELTFADISVMLKYEPDTGKFFWLSRPTTHFSSKRVWARWNTRYAGTEAFTTKDPRGYARTRIFDKNFLAHRVAWILSHQEWPTGEIDHIDGNPANNRISNLRLVSHRENQLNMKRRSDNKSGVTGVTWDGARKVWRATIQIDRKHKALGEFAEFDAAVSARKSAEAELGFHANHGR